MVPAGNAGVIHMRFQSALSRGAEGTWAGRSTPAAETGGAYPALRTVAERAAALVLLAGVAPLLVVLAVLVRRTSPGPALYRQLRLGRNGVPFMICKLRTMEHDCEAQTGPVWSAQDDPRVTRIGRLLRDTHLDELPQLWNVARGEMSLIGPRPERPEIARKIERKLPAYARRLGVKPGMTGLAQLLLPPDSDLSGVEKKLAQDLRYIRTFGPQTDARIAVATVLYFLGRALGATSRWLVGPKAAPRSDAVRVLPPAEDADAPALRIETHESGEASAWAAAA